MSHFADRLLAACNNKGKGAPICVGLDPVLAKLPDEVQDIGRPVTSIETFSLKIIDSVAEHVPCVKIQSACFERYRGLGLASYFKVVNHAREAGLIVIADAKRGDIGISSAHYAAGCLSAMSEDSGNAHELAASAPKAGADALTVNGYLGMDGLEPFMEAAKLGNKAGGQGLFALVRTSNPGSDAIQSQKLADGRTVAELMADEVAGLGKTNLGESGYSNLGAVVGATKAEDVVALRNRMPEQIFLVPGFGAQGGKADDVKACFFDDGDKKGTGAIITSSRGIIYAFQGKEGDWQQSVTDAAKQMGEQINEIIG